MAARTVTRLSRAADRAKSGVRSAGEQHRCEGSTVNDHPPRRASGETRTRGQPLRRRLLYPTELPRPVADRAGQHERSQTYGLGVGSPRSALRMILGACDHRGFDWTTAVATPTPLQPREPGVSTSLVAWRHITPKTKVTWVWPRLTPTWCRRALSCCFLRLSTHPLTSWPTEMAPSVGCKSSSDLDGRVQ